MEKLIARLDLLLERINAIFAPEPSIEIQDDVIAWRWRGAGSGRGGAVLEAVEAPHKLALDDLMGIDRQKQLLTQNTAQFVAGLPANNALLWGARGTGKSSLVKALLNHFAADGLRVIELDAHDLTDLPHVVAPLRGRPERFILFVDDLSFDADDASYRTLKAALDGSVAVAPENVLIYATSNRRHLVPEYQTDNTDARIVDGELHHGEAVEEKISLSERFGIWLSFHPFSQALYLEVVAHWLKVLGEAEMTEEVRREALQWALQRGNRSGRVAAQFARDLAGREALKRLQGKG
ncbi:ATP-binding protein [Granulosicoccaceae sp. 1_MG-2023]|nr:ATP-binding protein [Granulosicoccaceae sp. 1_MG-2023]